MMRRCVTPLLLLAVVIGCGRLSNPASSIGPVVVTIRDQSGLPVVGATVEGGIDWGHFRLQTDSEGKAAIAPPPFGQPVVVYKSNYLPIAVWNVPPGEYTLKQTSKKLDLVGNVTGKAIRSSQDRLLTLSIGPPDFSGIYRVYSFTNQSVTETFSQPLLASGDVIRGFRLLGDTLWLTTHESGIFVYLIQNATKPEFLFHLAIPGHLGPFAVKGSLVVVGTDSRFNPGPLRFWHYDSGGQCMEISRVEKYFVQNMGIIADALVLFGGSESLPTIFDISNPADPELVYHGLEPWYSNGFLYGEMAIISYTTAGGGYAGSPYCIDHKALDLSSPSGPTESGVFIADSWITGMTSDTLAYGNYYYGSDFYGPTISLLAGNISGGFSTVATISEGNAFTVDGTFPPYFLIGDRLWELVDR